MNEQSSESDATAASWQLIRDIGVLQVKLLVDGFRDLMLVPASLVAGILSLVSMRDGRPGQQFYHLLEWGKQTERWIDLFGAAKNSSEALREPPPFAERGMDDIVARVEAFIVDEYKSGGVTAQAKEQLDKILRSAKRSDQSSK